jgi:hypothetical protein
MCWCARSLPTFAPNKTKRFRDSYMRVCPDAPLRVRYYLERRDLKFKEKMAGVLCVDREMKILKEAAVASKTQPGEAAAIISYDGKPGIQAIANTAQICCRTLGCMRTSHVITGPSAMAQSACWPASICRPMPWSGTGIAAASSSNFSASSRRRMRFAHQRGGSTVRRLVAAANVRA